MKYLLDVSLHPVGRCLFYAVRAVGVKDGGRMNVGFVCRHAWAGLTSRRLGGEGKNTELVLVYKNLFLAPNSRQPVLIFKLKRALCAHL